MCGEGFRHDGDVGCEPILPDAPCPVGLMAIPGERECRPVMPCGAGTWGDLPVDDATEYVDQSYDPAMSGASDGSALHPWTTIAEAIAAAAPRALVAVAAGTYAEDVLLSTNVRLWGVCPERVEIAGTAQGDAAIVVLTEGSGSEIGGLGITGGTTGMVISNATDVVLDRLWVHSTASWGIDAEAYFGPPEFRLLGSLIEQCTAYGVHAGGAEAFVDASVVRDTQPTGTEAGRGMSFQAYIPTALGTVGTLTRSVVEQNQEVGVLVAGADLTMESTVVRGTSPRNQAAGRGIHVQANPANNAPSHIIVRTSFIAQNYEMGVNILGSEGTFEATVVRDTLPAASNGMSGRGISLEGDPASGPARLVANALLLDQNHEVGVALVGAEAELVGVVLRATQPRPFDGQAGIGAATYANTATQAPSLLTLRGSLVDQSHDMGLYLTGATVSVVGTVVQDTMPRMDDNTGGRGINIERDPTTDTPTDVSIRTSVVDRNHEVAVYGSGVTVAIEDTVLRATVPRATDMKGGRGIDMEVEAQLTLRRTRVERNHEIGVYVSSSNAVLEGVEVIGTLPNGLDEFGDGLLAIHSIGPATVSIDGSFIDASTRAAISNFGAFVSLGGVRMRCQAFDINGETYDGSAPELEDRGDNLCGCPVADSPCKSVAVGLQAPPPISE
jgi:hypothetical protein